MHDMIAIQMMRRCLETIENQRAQIAHLAPKAEAYDRIGILLDMQGGNRNRSLGAEVDVSWNLRNEIERATERMSREKSQKTTRTEPIADEDVIEREDDDLSASAACQAEAAQRGQQAMRTEHED